MYIYDRKLSCARSLLKEQPDTSQPADNLMGQCPPKIQGNDIDFLVTALEDRRNFSNKKRINMVTDLVFLGKHPERLDMKNIENIRIIPLPTLQSAGPEEKKLIQEWLHIRNCLVIPVHRAWLKLKQKSK
jgi:hypothetical protein